MFRLLIADDEMIERTVLQKTLSRDLRDTCQIYQAENGREALRIYEEHKIQIAILDIEMPGINGIEAAKKIRERDKDCSIIFLTAYDEFAYAKQAITVRALDYLLKPYNDQELLLVVEEAMRLAGEKKTGPHKKGGSAEERTEIGEEPVNVRLSKVMDLILAYIRENYQQDISMQDAARAMNYSEAYFCKLFKQCFQKNFTSYLAEYRIEEAKELLESPTVNVKEIGRAVGYGDPNYFAKVFKRITGKSPTEYRLDLYG